MSTITKDVVLGQKMILVRDYYKEPESVFVIKVNKTTFLVDKYNELLFYLKPCWKGMSDDQSVQYELRNRVSRRQCCRLFHYTEEKYDELKKEHDDYLDEQEEKKQQKDKERQERLQKQQEQIIILKDVFGYYPTMDEIRANRISGIQWMQMGNKGSIAIVTLPKECINQKWNPVEWKVLVIKMVEGKQWDYDSSHEKLAIETSVTYTTDRSGSFPSCSSNFYATEEEALWESIRYGVHEDR